MKKHILGIFLILMCLTSCKKNEQQSSSKLKIVAPENFLADIASNIAGSRADVTSIFPVGMDPHSFEPSVQDAVKISGSSLIIINGGGLEPWVSDLIKNAGGNIPVVTASEGLKVRTPRADEAAAEGESHEEGDPHFWMDPMLVIKYAENIRDGLSKIDSEGTAVYAKNTEAYIARLKDLDGEIRKMTDAVPAEKRLLVTNHESLGYFADEYNFTVVGTILLSSSSMADPSAEQMASLIEEIQKTGTQAVFLENGSNTAVAEQISKEAHVKLVTGLYTHSLTDASGPASTYIDMIRYDAQIITDALR